MATSAASNKKDKNQQIQVFVRLRPIIKHEGHISAVEIKGSKELNVKYHSNIRTYNFDRVFGPDSTQNEVYKFVAEPVVAEVICGYNCTILAYGQTGTGKTHTMVGKSGTDSSTSSISAPWLEDMHAGIIPRTLSHMFDELRIQQIEYTVRISYIELYNEEIFDLLSPVEDNTKLKLYDDNMKKGSVIVQGLTEITVNNKSEVFQILEKGAEKRRMASTLMNAQSSRSHTVFCITVHTKENAVDGEDLLKTGKLYLVDLAGSENIKQSGATDIRAREAFNINQSLLTLGRCISKLLERSTHVPYRESKLTRLLQDSLGGRTKTTLIATISPAPCNVDETLNTLDYANRAKHVTNKPEINQRLTKKALIKDYTEEIERLRRDLLASRAGRGIFLDPDNYGEMVRKLESYKNETTEYVGQIRAYVEEIERVQKTCDEMKLTLNQKATEIEEKTSVISNLEVELKVASSQIDNLKEQNEIKQFIVEKHCETEQALKSTARKLITVANVTTGDTKKLHDKIESLSEIHKYNKSICEQQATDFSARIERLINTVTTFHAKQGNFHNYLSDTVEAAKVNYKSHNDHINKVSLNVVNLIANLTSTKETNEAELNQLGTIDDKIQNIEKQESDVLMKFAQDVQPVCREMHEMSSRYNDFTIKAFDEIDTMFNVNMAFLDDFVEMLKSSLHDLIKKNEMDMEQQITSATKLMDCIRNNRSQHKEHQAMMERKFSELQRINTEYFEAACSQNKMHENLVLEQLDSYKATATFVSDAAQYMNTAVADFTKQIRESMVPEHENNIRDIENKRSKLNEEVTETKINMDTTLDKFNVNLTTSYLVLKNSTEKDFEIINNHKENGAQRISSHQEEIRKLDDNIKTNVNEFITRQQDQADQMIKEIVQNDALTGSIESVVSTELDQCNEDFKNFLYQNFKEYKQTGYTPQRKTYKYPKYVAETKVPDKLVEEFYKTKTGFTDEMDSDIEIVEEPITKSENNLQVKSKINDENSENVQDEYTHGN